MRRKTNVYDPTSKAPFNVSRSKIALFLECPQCFWLDRRLGIARPDQIPFNLNNAVDHLFKKEFDTLREQKQPHRLMLYHRIEAIPFWHPQFPIWRDDNNMRMGAQTLHQPTGLNIHGIIDDIWINKKTEELHIVDYKSTSTDYPISLDSKYKEGYKRQMEVYQWIFRRLAFNVSSIGYFVFANASKNRPGFGGKLEFENSILEYQGNTDWIEPTIIDIKKCLISDQIPDSSKGCQYCKYRKLIASQSLKNQMSLI